MSDAIASRGENSPPTPARIADDQQGQALPKAEANVKGAAAQLEQPNWAIALEGTRASLRELDKVQQSLSPSERSGFGKEEAAAWRNMTSAVTTIEKDPVVSFALKEQKITPHVLMAEIEGGRITAAINMLDRTENVIKEAHRQALETPATVKLGEVSARSPGADPVTQDNKPASIASPVSASSVKTQQATSVEETIKPAEKQQVARTAEAERDPVVELVSRLQGMSVTLTDRDAGLARGINKLAETVSSDPSTNQERRA